MKAYAERLHNDTFIQTNIGIGCAEDAANPNIGFIMRIVAFGNWR
jgi:hypothetical protein